MSRQPRFITSKFDGKCADCGRDTRAGERVYWRARGEVECGDCAAFNGRDGAPAVVAAAPVAQSVGADSDPAMTWDDTPPSAGASIGQRNGTDPHAASNRLIANAVARDPSLIADTGRKFGAHHPNADNCDECGRLDELSHNDHTGTALCGESAGHRHCAHPTTRTPRRKLSRSTARDRKRRAVTRSTRRAPPCAICW